MTGITDNGRSIRRHADGSIDYHHYDALARRLRSGAMGGGARRAAEGLFGPTAGPAPGTLVRFRTRPAT